MDENENLVTEEVAENTEQTVEESPKIYSEEEFNSKLDDIIGKKLARREAKIRKEYDEQYGGLINTLKAGTGKEDVGEISEMFANHYASRGVKIPPKEEMSSHDIEVLARADAEDIINSGYDEVVEEVDRLASIGVDKMSAREKAMFKTLAEHRKATERSNELAAAGITEDVYNSKDFKEFASKFNSNTPIRDIYDIYNKTIPRKEFKTMGSMKHSQGEAVKDFYTEEEISRLTEKDLDDPRVWEAVRRSMTGG